MVDSSKYMNKNRASVLYRRKRVFNFNFSYCYNLYKILEPNEHGIWIIDIQVPEDWELDPKWEGPNSNQLSHLRENPSQWKAADSDQEPLKTVRIIDKFDIPRKHSSESPDDTSGSETE